VSSDYEKARARAYYEQHKATIRARQRAYYQAHRAYYRAKFLAFQRDHPSRRLANGSN
jgi:hypothetical protein